MILNLRAVGVSEASFSRYYYMVCMSWVAEKGRGQGRSGRKEPQGEEGTTLPRSCPGARLCL